MDEEIYHIYLILKIEDWADEKPLCAGDRREGR